MVVLGRTAMAPARQPLGRKPPRASLPLLSAPAVCTAPLPRARQPTDASASRCRRARAAAALLPAARGRRRRIRGRRRSHAAPLSLRRAGSSTQSVSRKLPGSSSSAESSTQSEYRTVSDEASRRSWSWSAVARHGARHRQRLGALPEVGVGAWVERTNKKKEPADSDKRRGCL